MNACGGGGRCIIWVVGNPIRMAYSCSDDGTRENFVYGSSTGGW